jgi:ABC-2 type transport system ATP-binding protein
MSTRTSTANRWLVAAMAVALLAVGCSDGEGGKAASSPTDKGSEATPGETCDQGATQESVTDEPVVDVPSDLTVTSFDGTLIRVHWFPSEAASESEPAPTVLMGPGWGQPGDTSREGAAVFGALGIRPLNEAGYNVLTWDPRGFGKSTGTATINAADNEGRDVQVLLDWVADQPQALTDKDGDPRVGMAGFSYGGGIQLTTASIDCRVDAIVPGLAWHSLETALYKAETVKSGWAGLLTQVANSSSVDPHSKSAYDSGVATGTLSEEDRAWFLERGPGDGIDRIEAPTLFVHGTTDTLFTLDEAITNFRSLRERDVPTKMLWFCGGHGTCLTEGGEPAAVGEASFAWLDRYVKKDESVDTGPVVDLIDQQGARWTGDDYPPSAGTPLTADGTGDLALVAEGGSGPLPATPNTGSLLDGIVTGITPAPAANSVDVPITADDAALAVGAPKLSLTYKGTTPDGEKPTRVFAQLVDDELNVVVGNQATPIEVTLDGETHTAEVELEVIAQYLEAGKTMTLQLVATTVSYGVPRLGGSISFEKIEVEVPTTEGLTQA